MARGCGVLAPHMIRVAQCLAERMSHRQIAIAIGAKTAKSINCYMKRIHYRLGVDNPVAIMRIMRERGLAEPALWGERDLPVVLSPRYLEIFNLSVYGARNKDIAAALGIEPGTVRTHLTGVLRALSCHDKMEMAYRYGHRNR